MDTYQVISEVTGVPEMTDLTAVYVETPSRRGDVFRIQFSANHQMNPVPYEPAVGRRCRVIRSRDGQDSECGGAVVRVTPLVVSLDGDGFR